MDTFTKLKAIDYVLEKFYYHPTRHTELEGLKEDLIEKLYSELIEEEPENSKHITKCNRCGKELEDDNIYEICTECYMKENNESEEELICKRCNGTGYDGHNRCDPPDYYICDDCNGAGRAKLKKSKKRYMEDLPTYILKLLANEYGFAYDTPLDELSNYTEQEIMNIKGFGKMKMQELKAIMNEYGIEFKKE